MGKAQALILPRTGHCGLRKREERGVASLYLPDIDENISDYCCSDCLQKVMKSVSFCK